MKNKKAILSFALLVVSAILLFFLINGKSVDPPVWENPGLEVKTEEIPFVDENYFFREPTIIHLGKGWNTVLLKVPRGGSSWKWMFTFIPVRKDGDNYKEVEGLKFSTEIK